MLWSKDGLHDSKDIVRGPRDEKHEQDEGESLRGLPLLLLLLHSFRHERIFGRRSFPKKEYILSQEYLRCLLDLVLPWQRIMSCSLNFHIDWFWF